MWLESKSCFVNSKGFLASGLKILRCVTWGALALVVVFGHTCGSNVISTIFSTTRVVGLIDGSNWGVY